MNNMPIGILLAAGQSQRFGGNKLLHPLINNTPMLMISAQKLASVLPGSIVVINPELQTYSEQLAQLGLRVVINDQAEQGMSSSIACGVNASRHASAWLITLADMPYIKPETLSLLANRLKQGAEIVAPLFDQQRGNPVGFSQRFKDELLSLQEDVGARHVITKHHQRLELLSTTDDGVLRDIDYPADIKQ
jgi:molybdenum cofactor cytidylyltransferase